MRLDDGGSDGIIERPHRSFHQPGIALATSCVIRHRGDQAEESHAHDGIKLGELLVCPECWFDRANPGHVVVYRKGVREATGISMTGSTSFRLLTSLCLPAPPMRHLLASTLLNE